MDGKAAKEKLAGIRDRVTGDAKEEDDERPMSEMGGGEFHSTGAAAADVGDEGDMVGDSGRF